MRLTDEERAERMRLYEQGLTDVEIGEKLYLATITVYSWRTKAGLPANGQGGTPKISAKEHSRRLKIFDQYKPKSYEALGRLIGLSGAGARNWMIRYGVGKHGRTR
jgi:hypothetical protein